jgi:hypothetical protein
MANEKPRIRGNDIGPTGQAVARNLKRLRASVPLRELQERLRAGGHEISASGLQKIEAGVRRVDVDDLVALAVALDVNPNALLFPHSDGEPAEITGASEIDFRDVWEWALGHNPLGGDRATYDYEYHRKIRPEAYTTPDPSAATAEYDDLEAQTQELLQRLNALKSRIVQATGRTDGDN